MSYDVMSVQEVSPVHDFGAENPVMPLGFKQTELGVIPEDWNIESIGKVFNLVNGVAFKPSDWKQQGTPIIRIQNLNDPSAHFNYSQLPVPERNRVATGDLLFAWSGTVGTSFGARIWHGPEGVLNQHIFKVTMDEEHITRRFSLIVFSRVEEDIAKQAHGFKASFLHVKKSDLIKIKLPVPPVYEQRAIATTLSDVDALLEELDRLITKKRDIKQGTVQQLLTGETRLPGFEGEWKTVSLGDIAAFYKGKGLPKSAISTFGEQPCIHYGELFTQYGVKIEKTISRTDERFDSFLSAANDVLMPTSDVTPSGLAKASCVTSDNVILGGDILVIRTDPNRVNGIFLSSIIRNDADQVLRLVTGTTVYHLYGSDMKKFIFSIQSLAEQNAIVATFSDMDTEIQALEQRRKKTAELKQGMMWDLLTGRTRLV